MTEYTKTKITFTLSLLAVLFVFYQILRELGPVGFTFFGLFLEIRLFYYAIVFLIGVAVYTHAIAFIRDRPVVIAECVGNTAYAMAIAVPALCVLLWITSWLARFVVFVSKSIVFGAITSIVLGVLSSVSAILVYGRLRLTLNLMDRKARVLQLSMEEVSHIDRASMMFQAGHYDLSVFEAFRAIESALQSAVAGRQISIRNTGFRGLLDASLKGKVLPQEMERIIEDIRILRNRAAHAEEPISATSAQHVLEQTRKILGAIIREVEPGEEI